MLCLCCLEATMAFRADFFNDGWYESVEQDPGECFSSDGEYGDSLVIGAIRLFTPFLVHGYDDGIIKIFWQIACSQ